MVAAEAGGKVKQQELSETSAKTFSLPQSTRLMEQVEQVSREPEIVQAETELPHHLWNVCFQGRQQNRVVPGFSILRKGGALPLVQQAAEQQ